MSNELDVVIGLGANLGEAERTLRVAVAEIRDLSVGACATSALYQTDPIGPPQPRYLNAAVRGRFAFEPHALLRELATLETRHGRVRERRWGPRTLDLDVLWISGVTLNSPELTVPHPRLTERAFALLPLLDVAPEAEIPPDGPSLQGFLEAVDRQGVSRIAGANWPEALSEL